MRKSVFGLGAGQVILTTLCLAYVAKLYGMSWPAAITIGVSLSFFGMLFGLYHWFLSVYTGLPATTGTVMISVRPIILGFQLFLQAIVLEIGQS